LETATIDASVLGSIEALFIMLRMSLENPKVINISGNMKSSMFAHEH